ncbi:MAG: hypothetical protein ACR2ME_01975 [Acidimicrobiia bacterium]
MPAFALEKPQKVLPRVVGGKVGERRSRSGASKSNSPNTCSGVRCLVGSSELRAPSRPLVVMGALSGAFIGGAGIAAVRIGEDSTPNPTVEAAIGWMVASPGWALIVAVLLPTLVSALTG